MYLYWTLLLFVVSESGTELLHSFSGTSLNPRWRSPYHPEDPLGKSDCVIPHLYHNWDIFLPPYKSWKKKLKNEFDSFFSSFIVL